MREERGLPLLVRLLVAAPVPPEDREAVLGDVEEELARRREEDGPAAWRWLAREILVSTLPWLRYRLACWTATGRGLGWLAGLAAVLGVLEAVNTDPVLRLVGTLPMNARLAVAVGLNLLATGTGGYVAGRLDGGPLLAPAVLLSATLLALAALVPGSQGPSLLPWGLPWALALTGSVAVGRALAYPAPPRASPARR